MIKFYTTFKVKMRDLKKTVNLIALIVFLMSNILTPISYATDDLDTPMDSSAKASEWQTWSGENENVSSRADSEWNEEEGEGSSNETKTQLDSSAKASEWQTWSEEWNTQDNETPMDSSLRSEWQDNTQEWQTNTKEADDKTEEKSAIDELKELIENEENSIQIVESEEIYWTWEYEWVKVEVYAQTWAFALWTILNIIPITWDDEMSDIQDVLEAQKNVGKSQKVIAFDITFLDPETEEELQPSITGAVQVTFNYEENEELLTAEQDEEQEVKVYHLNDKDEEWEKIENITWTIVEDILINEEASEEVENWLVIDAESFSYYTIVVQIREEAPDTQTWQYGTWKDYLTISIAKPSSITESWLPEWFTIMDRNLWATATWYATTQSSAINWYKYQWWNNYWFSDSTTVSAVTTWLPWDESYNHNGYVSKSFINGSSHDYDVWDGNNPTANDKEHHDWIWWWENDNADNWRWAKLTNYAERQWPCPEGWHVPSAWEWWLLIRYWAETDNNATYWWDKWLYYLNSNHWAFQQKFNLPFAGGRNYSNASLSFQGFNGYYWSSSPNSAGSDSARLLGLDSSNVYADIYYYRALGFSVRCFKDSYVASPESSNLVDTQAWVEGEDFETITISNPEDSSEWFTIMDRNLWASISWTVCDKTNDTWACGFLYQWWNNYWFPITETVTPVTTWLTWNNVYNNHGYFSTNFINWSSHDYDVWDGTNPTANDKEHHDWVWWWANDDQSANNWWLDSNNPTDRQWPCPVWYHIPSAWEWWLAVKYWRDTYATNVTLNWSNNLYYFSDSTARENFMKYFKLPFAGLRNCSSAGLVSQGSIGYYWSSSPYGSDYPDIARGLYLDSSLVNASDYGHRAYGFSVRCFKDSYLAPQSYNLTFNSQGGSEVVTWTTMENTSRTRPSDPTKTNYTFVNWYTSTGYDTIFDFSTTATANTTVYAKWHYNSCPENYDYDEDLGICYIKDTTNTVPVYYGTDLTHQYNSNNIWTITVKLDDGNTITMMDMNLWSTTSWTNSSAYWELYQRWNNAPIRSTTAVDYSSSPAIYENYWPWRQYSNSNFIKWNSDYWSGNLHYDVLWWWLWDVWITTSVNTFWWWINNWNTRQWPCPEGYHVPSIWEWNALITYWYNTKNPSSAKSYTSLNSFNDSSFKTAFKLPLAGGRNYSSAGLDSQGSDGYYWSSSPYGSDYPYYARYLTLNSSYVNASSYSFRALGFSVRCFKDSSLAPETYTLELDANGWDLLWADANGKLNQKVESWKKAQEPVSPTKAGATFQGWTIERDGETEFDFDVAMTSSTPTTLYAKYKTKKAYLKYTSDLRTSLENIASGSLSNVYHFERSDTIPNEVKNDSTKIISADDSEELIYAWFQPDVDSWTLYYYSDAPKVSLRGSVQGLFNGNWSNIRTLDLSDFDTSEVTNMEAMFNWWCSKLTNLDVSNFDTSSVTNMKNMFKWCSSLTSLDVSNFDTSSVTNMESMFNWCSSLTSLDVSNFNTSKVTAIGSMFNWCSSLTSLDVSNWDIARVQYMGSMFNWCSSLTSLDVSRWDTSRVSTMRFMFQWCSGLTSLDVSSWNTSGVTTMESMFKWCSSLTSLDVSNFDTSSVTVMSSMFNWCSTLTSIDVSNWNIVKVQYMGSMFRWCSSLTSLDVSRWNTSRVSTMGAIFQECSSLTSLDVSSWDTSSATDMKNMFNWCSNLKTIYATSGFDTSNVWISNHRYMFNNTLNLVWWNGTKWLSSTTNKTYAKIDNENQTWYFTDPSHFAIRFKNLSWDEIATQWISTWGTATQLSKFHASYAYYTSPDKSTPYNFSTKLYAYSEVYAEMTCDSWYVEIDWECLQQFTVTFNATANGGTTQTWSVQVITGETLDLSKYTANKSDYQFVWWNTNSGAIAAMQNPTITTNTTLYAIFTKTVAATFKPNGNKLDNGTADVTVSCPLYNKDTSCPITTPTITANWTNTPIVVGYTTSENWVSSASIKSNASLQIAWWETYYAHTKSEDKILHITYEIWTWVASIWKTSDSCTLTWTYNWEAQATSCTVKAPIITVSEGYKDSDKKWTESGTNFVANVWADITLTQDSHYIAWAKYIANTKPMDDLQYTIRYEDVNHKTLKTSETVTNQIFWTTVTVTAPDIDWYIKPSSQQITIAVTNPDVVFVYNPRTNIEYTVTYKDTKGNSLLTAKTVNTWVMDTEVSETAPVIDGYTVQTGTLSITLKAENNHIDFVYTPNNNISYTVYYKSWDVTLHTAKTVNNKTMAETVTESAENIPWYTVDENSKQLTLKATDNTITFNYTPNNNITYTVKYQTANGSGLAADKVVENQTMASTVEENAKNIPWYTVDWSSKSLKLAATDNVIIFTYSPIEYAITFVDESNTHPTIVRSWDYLSAVDQDYPDWSREGYTIHWDKSIPETMPLNGLTITASWTANTNTAYKIEHYKEKLDWTYELADTEPKTWTTDTTATATPKTYEWFTFSWENENTITSGNIAWDGSLVLKLFYTRNSYDVKYQFTNTPNWHSSLPTTQKYKYWATVTIAPKATAPWYSFSWDRAESFTMPANNVVITWTWTAHTNTQYLVYHQKEKLDWTYETVVYTWHWTTDTKVTPTVNTYSWFNSPEAQEITIEWDGNTVLIYQYSRKVITLTLVNDNGTPNTIITWKYEADVQKPAKNPSKTWYTFTTWSPSIPNTFPAISGTYTAQWNIITYDIEYHLNGWTQSNPKTQYTVQTDTFSLVNPTRENYIFAWWTWSNGSTLQKTVTITKWTTWDKEYYANWDPDFNHDGQNDGNETKYTVKFVAWEDGTLWWKTEYTNILSWLTLRDVEWYSEPIKMPDINYIFSGWTPKLNINEKITWNVIYTWIFVPDINHNNVDDRLDPYFKVVFSWWVQWILSWKTEYENILVGLTFQQAGIIIPEVLSRSGYVFKWWTPNTPQNSDIVWNNITYNVIWKVDTNNNWIADAEEQTNNSGWSSSWWWGWKRTPSTDTHWVADDKTSWNDVKDSDDKQKDWETWLSQQTQEDKGENLDKNLDKNTDWENVKTIAVKNTEYVATLRTVEIENNTNYTEEFNEAYWFAKANGITTTSSIEKAKMNTNLTRIQMAKMLSNFAINVLWEEPDPEKWIVKFNDVTNKMDKQYDNAVTKAYQLGIMWQNMKNNEFRPNDEVTRAEFASALSRLLYKTNEWKYKSTWNYYIPHIAKLYQEWIINKTDPKMKEKRWYVMLMLMRSVQ